jgi:hypothetical protein
VYGVWWNIQWLMHLELIDIKRHVKENDDVNLYISLVYSSSTNWNETLPSGRYKCIKEAAIIDRASSLSMLFIRFYWVMKSARIPFLVYPQKRIGADFCGIQKHGPLVSMWIKFQDNRSAAIPYICIKIKLYSF